MDASQSSASQACTPSYFLLDGAPVTIVGHSLGGVNAYQFAAHYPELVNADIVEDISVELMADLSFAEKLPHRSPSLHDLRKSLEEVGVRVVDYFSERMVTQRPNTKLASFAACIRL